MKRGSVIVFLAVCMIVLSSGGMLFAEENESLYTFGTVVGVTENSITIEEVTYDGENDVEIIEETVYELMDDTKVENVESIGEIQQGNEVDLEYVESDGKNKAVYIYAYDEQFGD